MLFTVVSVALLMLFVAVPPPVPLKVRLLKLTGVVFSTHEPAVPHEAVPVFQVELPVAPV